MRQRILITGSSGLIGTGLHVALQKRGADLRLLDLRGSGSAIGDVRDQTLVREAVDGCDGIVHLAAVSRVIWGEQDPGLCRETNVGGLKNVLTCAAESLQRPWVVFASSREVYGQPAGLPADEDSPLRAMNVYGHTKVAGERLVGAARECGLRACTIRLSNVFGSTDDHHDRVVPAFARGAALGQELRVDGAHHTFDFTHVDDVSRGIVELAELLAKGEPTPPPIHFVSGVPTTLLELATLANRLAASPACVRLAPPRDFDVARFYGSPARAHEILGWKPTVSLEAGLRTLIHSFRYEQCQPEFSL
jgi:UDP-glucose 4-epimerase